MSSQSRRRRQRQQRKQQGWLGLAAMHTGDTEAMLTGLVVVVGRQPTTSQQHMATCKMLSGASELVLGSMDNLTCVGMGWKYNLAACVLHSMHTSVWVDGGIGCAC